MGNISSITIPLPFNSKINLDAILSKCNTASAELIVGQIIPWSNGSSAQKETLNDFCIEHGGKTYYTIENTIRISNEYVIKDHIFAARDLELYEPNKLNQSNANKTTMINLRTSYNNIFKKEPQKSFEKLGITDENGFLTTDGRAIFDKWRLKRNQDEFFKEIVEPMKKQMEKDKK